MELELTLFVEVDGIIIPGTPDRFDPRLGNFLPGDPALLQHFTVCLRRKDKVMDITQMLHPSTIEDLMQRYFSELMEAENEVC